MDMSSAIQEDADSKDFESLSPGASDIEEDLEGDTIMSATEIQVKNGKVSVPAGRGSCTASPIASVHILYSARRQSSGCDHNLYLEEGVVELPPNTQVSIAISHRSSA